MGATVTPYWLRMLIAFDALIALTWRYGTPGVTMSSRFGTAAAHGHRYGIWASYCLDRMGWLGFGRDADGTSHCCSAFRGDIGRNIAGLWEILGDQVVVKFGKLESFEPELQWALKARAERIEREQAVRVTA